jgi:hypothetical protein
MDFIRKTAGCMCFTTVTYTTLFAWGRGIVEDICYERRLAEARVGLVFIPARVGLVFNTSQRRKGEEGPSSSSSSLGTLEPAPLKSGIGALRRNVKFVVDASGRAGAPRGGGSKMARHCRHGEEPDPGHGGDPPRPAAPRLCGPAARGRAHARRLQDPLGVHAALGGASARRYRHVGTTRGQLWRRAAAGLDGADTVLRRRRPPRRRLTVSLGRY